MLLQEATALAAVQSQLETFRSEMQQGSLSHRQAGQLAVRSAVQRAERFVDRTLRLSNFSSLSAYLIGQGPLPVSRSFQVSANLQRSLHAALWKVDEATHSVCCVF